MESRARRPNGEEQLRVFITADSTVTPVHGGNTPLAVASRQKNLLLVVCSTVGFPVLRTRGKRFGCDRIITDRYLIASALTGNESSALGTLVNAFTNSRDVKGDAGKRDGRVSKLTTDLPGSPGVTPVLDLRQPVVNVTLIVMMCTYFLLVSISSFICAQ
jgi:hypothetical protein